MNSPHDEDEQTPGVRACKYGRDAAGHSVESQPEGFHAIGSAESGPARVCSDDPITDLLLGVIRWLADGQPVEGTEILQSQRAEETVKLAALHGLGPALYAALEERDPGASRRYPQLHRAFLGSVSRAARATEQLRECLDALTEAGVRCLLLKGIATSLTLYASPMLRRISDMDILVQWHEVGKALDVLCSVGYRKESTAFSAEDEWLNLTYLGGLRIVRANSLPLELHCAFLHGYGNRTVSVDDTWRNAVTLSGEWGRAEALPVEFAFIHAAVHLYTHYQRSIPYLKDVADLLLLARAIERQRSWARMWETAERWSVRQEVTAIAAFVNTHVDARIPAVDNVPPPFSADDLVHIMARLHGRRRLTEGLVHRLAMIRLLPGWLARVRYLLRMAIPRPEYLRWRYRRQDHDPVWPLYLRHLLGGAAHLVQDVWLRRKSARR